ncbi:MAG TPA: hypothetical protein VFA26_03305 [Gemmataceae bacterium]|nr:hypothetical protein [Gemmataceae bacterium]
MSSTFRLSTGLIALAAGALLLVAAPGRAGDLQDSVRLRNRIAAQKFDAELREGVAEYDRLLKTDPAAAAAILKTLLRKVENDTTLDESRHQGWIKALSARIRIAESRAGDRGNGDRGGDTDLARLQKRLAGNMRASEFEKLMAQQDQINQSFGKIRELRMQGRSEEANRLAAELKARYPNNPSILAANRTTYVAKSVADGRNLISDRERRLLGVYGQVDRSSLPPVGEVEFPADWKDKIAKRGNGVRMTETEKRILQALNTPVDGAFDGQGFEDVIGWLAERFKVPVVLDKKALDELNIDYKTPIKYNPRKATLRTTLRRILADLGLAYVVKDEQILITSQLKAREELTTRAYYVADLINGFNLQMGPFASPFMALQGAAQIIDLIQNSVEPQSWQVNGGPGTIRFDPLTMSILVKQTAEVHFILAGGLGR